MADKDWKAELIENRKSDIANISETIRFKTIKRVVFFLNVNRRFGIMKDRLKLHKNRKADMMYTRQKGRPADVTGRLEKEIRVYELLDSLGVEYERIDHEAAFTMEACEKIDEALEAVVCKNLFLCNRQKTMFYLLMMPGDKPFKTKELSAQIGSARLSFADEAFMEEFLDITPGSVSIMGLMNDKENKVRLLVDEDVLKGEYLGCHPCINTSSLRLKTKDVFGPVLNAMHHDMTVVTLKGEEN